MKLFISIDLEGFPGVSAWHEVDGTSNAFFRHQKIITEQVVHLCTLLQRRYPNLNMITLCDSHSKGDSVIYDMLPRGTELVKGFPRQYYMMEGIDDTYSGIIYIGYHTGVGGFGNMDHTYSSSVIYELKINGMTVDEFLINSYLAGEYNIPIVCSIGGDRHIDDVTAYNNSISTVVTKKELGKFSSIAPSPSEFASRLERTILSLREPDEYPVFRINPPIYADIMLTNTLFAETASWIPNIERTGGRTVRITAQSMKEFYSLMMTMLFSAWAVK